MRFISVKVAIWRVERRVEGSDSVQAVLRLHSQTDIDSVEHTCANFSVLDRVEPATQRSITPFDL